MPVAEAKGVHDSSDVDASKYADEKLMTGDAKVSVAHEIRRCV